MVRQGSFHIGQPYWVGVTFTRPFVKVRKATAENTTQTHDNMYIYVKEYAHVQIGSWILPDPSLGPYNEGSSLIDT